MGKAQANLGLAQSNYQRDLEVFKPGYISQAAFDTTKAQLKVAESEVNAFQATVTALEAAVKQAESETHAAQALHNYTRILAPMDGLITARKAEVGTTVVPGTPIFQMVDLDTRFGWPPGWTRARSPKSSKGSRPLSACVPGGSTRGEWSGSTTKPTPSPGNWKWM